MDFEDIVRSEEDLIERLREKKSEEISRKQVNFARYRIRKEGSGARVL